VRFISVTILTTYHIHHKDTWQNSWSYNIKKKCFKMNKTVKKKKRKLLVLAIRIAVLMACVNPLCVWFFVCVCGSWTCSNTRGIILRATHWTHVYAHGVLDTNPIICFLSLLTLKGPGRFCEIATAPSSSHVAVGLVPHKSFTPYKTFHKTRSSKRKKKQISYWIEIPPNNNTVLSQRFIKCPRQRTD
jgi:hypothetical protein